MGSVDASVCNYYVCAPLNCFYCIYTPLNCFCFYICFYTAPLTYLYIR